MHAASLGGFSGSVTMSCAGDWTCTALPSTSVLPKDETLYPHFSFSGPPYAPAQTPMTFTATVTSGGITRTQTFRMQLYS